MTQGFIAFFGLAALLLLQSDHSKLRQWGSVVGLAGQPFWLYATVQAGQWGMLLLSFLYTAAYAWGVYKHFWRK